jgi:hypothetical protein
MPLPGDRTPVPVITSPFNEYFAALSPDGRWLAYGSNKADGGNSEVYVQSYPVANQDVRISSNGGQFAAWSADGRRLYFLAQDAIMAADLSISGGKLSARVPIELFRRPGMVVRLAFDPVGPRFLLAIPPEGAATQGQLTVVLNWLAMVSQ